MGGGGWMRRKEREGRLAHGVSLFGKEAGGKGCKGWSVVIELSDWEMERERGGEWGVKGWHFGVSLGDHGERGGLRGIGYRACGVSPVEKNAGGKGCVGWFSESHGLIETQGANLAHGASPFDHDVGGRGCAGLGHLGPQRSKVLTAMMCSCLPKPSKHPLPTSVCTR